VNNLFIAGTLTAGNLSCQLFGSTGDAFASDKGQCRSSPIARDRPAGPVRNNQHLRPSPNASGGDDFGIALWLLLQSRYALIGTTDPNGMIAPMSDAPLNGTVALLDDAPLDDLVGVVEVLVQEGVPNLALPASAADFEELATLYGQRVRIGAHGQADNPATLRTLGAEFILPDFLSLDTATVADALGLACYASAMTPNEIVAALKTPVTGVQLRPVEVVGSTMAEHLQKLGLIDKVVPRGGLIAFTAKQWLKAGAPAVCMGRHLLGDALTGGDLAALRDRCRSLRN